MSTAAATSPSGRVQQGPADDESPDGGQLEGAPPAGVGVLRVTLRVAPEQQRRQGRGVHDPARSSTTGSFSQVWALEAPRPAAMCDRLDRRLGVEQVDHTALAALGEEGLDHGHEPELGQLGDGPGAGLERGDRAGVAQRDAREHLAPVEAAGGEVARPVGGETVVELEDRALEAAAVHRADDHLALEGAEQEEVVEDVGSAEHPVHTRAGDGGGEAAEQLAAARHGRPCRPGPRARHAPGGRRRRAAGGRRRPRPADGPGWPRPGRCDAARGRGSRSGRPRTRSGWWSS